MLVIQCCLNVIHSGIWHSATFKNIKPLSSCFCFCDLFNQTIDLNSVFDPVAVRDKAVVRFPLWMPESVTENTKKSVVAAAKENVPVKGLVASVGDD